uniref:Solute carrier family 41 member n=1 Tax=Periophthalmus magnuspinnatus TaxID=409849 RepID=A0A3B4A2Z4_9GOBI
MALRPSQEEEKLLSIPRILTSVQYGSQVENGETKPSNNHFLWDYSETDSLLSNENYGGSRRRRSSHTEIDPDQSNAHGESICSMLLQILVPFILAGLGTVSAGMLLEVVQVREYKGCYYILTAVKEVLGFVT